MKLYCFLLFMAGLYAVAAQIEPVVLVHGGAGTISDDRVPAKYRGMKLAARLGYKKLMETNSVVDAVEEAVRAMELDSAFNAGYGSVLNSEGIVQMDASFMTGTGDVGCVAGIEDILHPISLARRVMDKTVHNFLAGEGAMRFARDQGFQILPPGSLISSYAKSSLELWNEMLANGTAKPSDVSNRPGEVGTVGAIAIDRFGNMAAATSTGGMTGKMPGRVGDSPLIGSGTYCDNRFGCVSTTGHGETIMKAVLAKEIVSFIERDNSDAQTASFIALNAMTARFDETAGVITIDKNGFVGKYHTSPQMGWAYQKSNEVHYGIRFIDDFVETIPN